VESEPRYWEPRRFEVGQRVRVRLSPECRHQRIWLPSGLRLPGHAPEEDGQTGTVLMAIGFDPQSDSHTIPVGFDTWFAVAPGLVVRDAYFAAAELEPLDADDADR